MRKSTSRLQGSFLLSAMHQIATPPPQRGKQVSRFSRLQVSELVVIFSLLLVSVFTYFVFALPSITYVSPTLTDNATTGLNWVFINVTSSENLNQSLLEWGNSTGFTNVSMQNSSMQNWWINITGLADGTYNYTVWAENTTGGWNQTGRRFVTIDTTLPYIAFVDPTPPDGNITTNNYMYINTTVSDASNTTAFIDWNRSLVLWMRFNNETGENSTFFRDWSTYGNNATCSGSTCPNYTASGKFGPALEYDGSNDYIDAGNRTSLNLNAVTIEAWIKVANLSQNGVIAATGGVGGASPYAPYGLWYWNTRRISFGVSNGTGKTEPSTSIGSLNDTNWHHVVGIWDGTTSANSLKIYLDGIPNVSTQPSFSGIGSNPQTLKIGSGTYRFQGGIDEVRIWNRILSPEEINASFNAGLYRLYHNFTGLVGGAYNYTAYTQDIAGNVNQTEQRGLRVDLPPVISFVSPTWPNNTQKTENWEYVNVTLNENGNVSLLEWNNGTLANYTMQGSGTNFYLNMTNQNGTITYKVYANDTSGNMGISEARTVTLNISFAISISSPQNQTYTKNWVWANVSLSDIGSWCGVSLNGTANQTMSNTSTTAWYLNLSVPSDGSNNVTFYCNTTSGTMFGSSVTYFTIDTTITGTALNQSGDTDIYDNTTWSNKNYTVNGKIKIYSGGNLTLINTTLIFNNSYVRQYYINLTGTGSLRILNSSRITTTNSSLRTYIGQESPTYILSHLEIRDSTLENMGNNESGYPGEYFAIEDGQFDSTSIVENSNFTNVTGGLDIFSASTILVIRNNIFRLENLSVGGDTKQIGILCNVRTVTDPVVSISNNKFYDNVNAGTGAIYPAGGCKNLDIYSNGFYNLSHPLAYTLNVQGGDQANHTIRNNYFENTKRSIVIYAGSANMTIENNIYLVTNTSITSLGIIGGSTGDAINIIIRNNTAYNITDHGMGGGTVGLNNTNWLVENNRVYDMARSYTDGIRGTFQNSRFLNNYFSGRQISQQIGLNMGLTSSSFNANNTYVNNTFEKFEIGLKTNSSVNITFVDTKLTNNFNYDIYFGGNSSGLKFINTQFSSSKVYFSNNNDFFNNYYYADILARDSTSQPLSNITLTVTNEVNSSYSSINRNGDNKTFFATLSDGHTPMPIGNNLDTTVLMDYWQTNSTQQNMTYTILAYDANNVWTNVTHTVYPNGTIQQLQPLANVSGINPDSSWYRSNPNTYQNTTTLQINYTRTNITVNAGNNATNITVNKWNTSLSAGNILVNFTASSVNGNNVNFTVCNLTASTNYAVKNDGSAFATKTGDSQGCIWFNNSAWSSHTFTVEEQSGTSLTACSDLSTANTYYTLTQNVSSPGTCFNILANNVTLDGQGYWVNYSQATAGYGVYASSRTNITIKNTNFQKGNASVNAYTIRFYAVSNSTIFNNTINTGSGSNAAIFTESASNYNNISNNAITMSGSMEGIYLQAGGGSYISNNVVSGGAIGLHLQSSSNTLVNNTVSAPSYAIYFQANPTNNNITGGSISGGNNEYYLLSAGTTNYFRNTNFVGAHKLVMGVTDWFNYNNETNGNIWLKTNISVASTLTRTLVTWSQSQMKWNDTNSTAGGVSANYIITGLLPDNVYKIYNTSGGVQTNPYNVTANSTGNINFKIALNGNTEIKAQADDVLPTVTLNSPANGFSQTTVSITFNCTAYDDINLTSVILYNDLNGTWVANGTNSSGINNIPYIFDRIAPANGTFTWNCLAQDNSSQSAFASQNYTITVDSVPPSSNSPTDTSYSQNSISALGWILYDNYAGGYYTVYRNGTLQNQSTWSNNTNLNVWVNTSTLGTWNYTITYNDSLGNVGAPDEVIITITGEPTITIQSPLNQTYAQKWVWANLSLSAAGSWCGVSLNGTANQTMSNTSTTAWYKNLSVPSEGSNNVIFYCNGTSGSMGNSSMDYFTVDTIAPNITSWSTNGTNASSPTDTMFLVSVNDSVLFNVTVADNTTLTYQWLVNKVDQNRNANNFTFIVPSCDHVNDRSSCIWEIYLTANDSAGQEIYKEWVVSNLTVSEAPYIFDSFSDNKYDSRADTDPWGRNLINWTSTENAFNISSYYVPGAAGKTYHLRANSSIIYGTWDFYFRFPNGGNSNYADAAEAYYASNGTSDSSECYYRWIDPSDEHVWNDYVCDSGKRYPLSYLDQDTTGSNSGCISNGTACQSSTDIGIGPAWHHVRIINDKRTGYQWNWVGLESVTEPFIPESMEYMDYLKTSNYFGILTLENGVLENGVYSIQNIDGISIYNETYLYPQKNVTYNSTHIILKNGLDPNNLWRLENISALVNNESLFSYNATTRTAYINVDNFVFDWATGFEMNNQTLIFNSTSPTWLWKSGLYMRIINSVIVGSRQFINIDAFPQMNIRNKQILSSGHIDILGSNLTNIYGPRFVTSYVWLDHINISNSYFLFNKTDTGIGTFFRVSPSSTYDYDIIFDNNTFDKAGGAYETGGSSSMIGTQGSIPYFYNTKFRNGILLYFYAGYPRLINPDTSGATLTPPPAGSSGNLMVKYYTDIQVKDAGGNNVSGASVIIANEINDSISDDIENLTIPQNHWSWYDNPGGTAGYHRKVTFDTDNEANTFYTGSNGHTPLPARESNTIVLTDYQRNDTYQTNYTYAITAYDPNNIWTNVTNTVYPNGTIQQLQPLANVSGVNPDSSWYRSNPNTYQNTTTLQINYTKTNITVNAGNNETNITINKWNTSLAQGNILVNFTASSVNGNNVNFTVCNLTASTTYTVKNDGSAFATKTSDSQGCIWFNNSVWTSHDFTVEEQSGTSLTACSDLSTANTYYTLTQNVSSPGTCFNVLANNVTLDGAGFTVNYSQTTTGYGVNITNRDNVTVKNLNVVQGNSSVSGAYGIYASGMTNSSIINNSVVTNGAGSYGIRFTSSNLNIVLNNNVTTTGGTAYTIYLVSSNANNITNNNFKTSVTRTFYLQSSQNNTIAGGSIVSNTNYDYALEYIGVTNNFTNTNFTAPRKINFYDTGSFFNYQNDSSNNIWLKTNISLGDKYLTRTLITWSQPQMKWNDTNSSASITAGYILTGLLPSTNYRVYNTSSGTQTNPYTLMTDVSGALNFTIALNGNTQIEVRQTTPPVYSSNSTSSTGAGTSVTHSLYWSADDGLSAYIFSFDNCTGSFVNETYTFSGIGNWSNVTKTTNSTVGCTIRWKVYANDTSNRWNESQTYSYVTTNNPPYYSNTGVNTTIAGQPAHFSAYWQDDVGLSGFIFSTNNSGTWQNETWQPMTGTGNWSNYTKVLNSTIGMSVGYRFYANDTANQWNDTGILTINTVKCNAIGAATYNATTNTIILNNQTSTLCTIYYDINNQTVLLYIPETDTYVLNAYINEPAETYGTPSVVELNLTDTILAFNSTSDKKLNITLFHKVTIQNSTIYSVNASNRWTISVTKAIETGNLTGSVVNSTIKNGRIWFNPGVYNNATPPIVIGGNTFKDYNNTESNTNNLGENMGPILRMIASTGNNASVRDNYFENIHLNVNLSASFNTDKIAVVELDASNFSIDNITFINVSGSVAMRFFGNDGGNISNFYIDSAVDGIREKEHKNSNYINGTIKNIALYGMLLNYGPGWGTVSKNNLQNIAFYNVYEGVDFTASDANWTLSNITIDNCTNGFKFTPTYGTINLEISNGSVYNCTYGFGMWLNPTSNSTYKLTEITASNNTYGFYFAGTSWTMNVYASNIANNTNKDIYFNNPTNKINLINSEYSILGFCPSCGNSSVYELRLIDVYAVDKLNVAVPNMTLDVVDEQYLGNSSVNIDFENMASFLTDSGGHTLLPAEKSNSAAVLDFWKNSTYQQNMTYTITVYDTNNIWTNVTHTIYPNGTIQQLQPLAQVTGVNPDASWYRANPNTYQNTTTLQINYTRTNLTVNANQNATNITVNKWNTSISAGNILVNFTTSSTNGNNVNFTICNLTDSTTYTVKNDGSAFATKTANSQGCIWFNNSVWSSHTFTVEEQASGPSVSLNSPSNSLITNNATLTFNCSASSGNPLVNITLFGNWSGWSAKNSTNITGVSNSSQWANTLADGSYKWNCLAYDTTGNASFAASNYTFTIDTTKPTLSFVNITPNNSATNNSWAYINITSSESLSAALLEWNGTAPNITMQGSGTNYYYNKTGLVAGNNYTFKVFANDSANNWNITETRWVYVNYTSCTESWSYSAWSACSNSVQTRTGITDANSCGTTVNQTQTQSCSSGTTTTSSGGGGGGGSTTTKTITVTPNDPLTKVIVNLKSSLESPSLTVSKVETIPVSAPSEPVYQYINITKANFNNTQIENATIDFKVNKSWILENNFTKIWLAHYENGWNKLRTDLVNSTATVNYYRAYTDSFSYFAIIGEKAQAAPPAVEPPKEAVNEEPKTETSKEPEKPPVEEPKKPYVAYIIAVILLVFVAYAAKLFMGKNKPVQFITPVQKKQEIKETPLEPQKNPPKLKKVRPKEDDLDDIQRRLEEIKRKLNGK